MTSAHSLIDVDAGRQLAKAHLQVIPDRWRHTEAVVERASEYAGGIASEDRRGLLVAAWLHDVGYAATIRRTGFHALDGAQFLEASGVDRRVVCLVAHHSAAVFEAVERGFARELAAYERETGPVMDALTCADMTVGPEGQLVTFEQRIAEILDRYPQDDPVHRAIMRAQVELESAVRRAEARVALAG
jgi:putative nucleotidyltransferase with HDIG domain